VKIGWDKQSEDDARDAKNNNDDNDNGGESDSSNDVEFVLSPMPPRGERHNRATDERRDNPEVSELKCEIAILASSTTELTYSTIFCSLGAERRVCRFGGERNVPN